jgi:KaiC/GvpD/RAD55 family RecA-like ATPase
MIKSKQYAKFNWGEQNMPDNLSLKSKVPGLDRLLMGGFKLPPAAEGKEQLGLILLIRGKPGTGKTTLALQITNAFLEWERSQNMKMDTMYFSLDQAQKDIESKLEYIRKKTVPLKNDSPKIKSYIDNDYYGSDPEKPIGYAAYSIEAALSVLHDLEKIDSTKGWCRNLTVVDGLNCLGKMDRQEIFELSTLIHLLRKTSRMSILVYEPMEHEEISVEYLVDMTIDLKGEIETAGHIDYFFHSLSITKSRYQATGLGWHKFKIKDNGIEVYPSIHFHVHQKGYLTDQFTKSQNPMSDRQQEEGKPVAISGYNDSSDFSIDEFRNQKKDPHKLFCSIEKASYSLEIKKLKSNKKIVDWLNKILKNPKLYDVIQEKTNLYLTDDMKRLKEKIDSIPYSSSKKIKDDDLRAINKFNRLIIERAHPLETPGIEFCIVSGEGVQQYYSAQDVLPNLNLLWIF